MVLYKNIPIENEQIFNVAAMMSCFRAFLSIKYKSKNTQWGSGGMQNLIHNCNNLNNINKQQ